MRLLDSLNDVLLYYEMRSKYVLLCNLIGLPIRDGTILITLIFLSFQVSHKDGKFVWSSIQQSTILTAFFYGYVVTQIPFGILSKKYGATWFLGVGMLINSLFGLLVPIAAEHSLLALGVVRFIQGLGEVSTNNSVVETCKPFHISKYVVGILITCHQKCFVIGSFLPSFLTFK